MKVLIKKGFKNYERDGKKLSEKDSRKFIKSLSYFMNLNSTARPKYYNKAAIEELEKLIPKKYQNKDELDIIVNDKVKRSLPDK